MASCEEKSPRAESSCVSLRCTADDKRVTGEKIQIQEQSGTEKPKINRLRRANRTKRSDLMFSERQVIRPDVSHDEKCSQTFSTRPPNSHGAQSSPPKRGLALRVKMSVGHEQEVKSESIASSHQQPSVLPDEAGGPSGRRSGAGRRDLHQREEKTVFNSCPESSASHRVKVKLQHQVQHAVMMRTYSYLTWN